MNLNPDPSPSWYPLVHGRTYEVDYRTNLLAVPPYFENKEIELVRPYILAAMDSTTDSGHRQNIYHQVLFHVGSYWVVGLACMAHQICPDPLLNRDKGNTRPLPIFLGYIANDKSNDSLPPLMDVGIPYSAENPGGQFSELYRYVVARWQEKEYQPQSRELHYVEDSCSPKTYDYASDPKVKEYMNKIGLNADEQKVRIWQAFPKEETISVRDKALWTMTWQAKGRISLCLGISSKRGALRSPYTNASVYDVDTPDLFTPIELRRLTPQGKAPAQSSMSSLPASQLSPDQQAITLDKFDVPLSPGSSHGQANQTHLPTKVSTPLEKHEKQEKRVEEKGLDKNDGCNKLAKWCAKFSSGNKSTGYGEGEYNFPPPSVPPRDDRKLAHTDHQTEKDKPSDRIPDYQSASSVGKPESAHNPAEKAPPNLEPRQVSPPANMQPKIKYTPKPRDQQGRFYYPSSPPISQNPPHGENSASFDVGKASQLKHNPKIDPEPPCAPEEPEQGS